MNFYAFIPKLLNMSLTASVAIVFVLLLRLMLKKAPKVISYALWAVVLFRLLCPVTIESSFSLFGLMDTPTTESTNLTTSIEYVPENIVHTEYPAVTLPVPGVSNAINDTLPSGREQLVADPLEAPVTFATYVWIAGVLVMAAYSVISYRRLRQKLLTASPLRDNIYLADEITSPFVMGLVRPKIYLPSDMEEREQAYIIRHEQHHIHRGDHIIKALAFLALSIHWFNPLVWVAFIYSNKDMEMSCDEAVVKKMGDGILADYTASLLSLATGKHIIAGMPLAFGEGDTKGRIRNLANWRKPAFWVVLVAVIACVALAVGLLTNPVAEREFPINGSNVSELDTEQVVEMIAKAEKLEDGSQLCVNADNFDLMFTPDFNWANDGAIRYFYTKDQTVYSAQLRMFHDDNKYFITDSDKWIEQEQIFKLFHYLDALKYMPQEEIRQLSPDADGYSVMMRHEGAPSDYERVLKYAQNGVNANDGWYIHLEVQPLHKVEGGGYNGTGDEVIHLFYNSGDKRDDIAGKTYLYDGEGFGGSFTITLYEDGTFTYYEGMLSSYIGTGSFMLDGDTVIMTDDGHGGYGLVNHFRHDGDDLVFVEQDSDNFVYVKVKDGEKFHCTGEAFKQNDNTDGSVQIMPSQKLSLNDVIMLSQKGYELSWSDFDQFKYIETGSGLYIRVYEINEMYELWIGGSWIDEDPMYIYLALADDLNTRIDIRDGGVTEFVGKDHSETLLSRAIYDAIINCNRSEKTMGLNHCASFVMLDKEEISGTPVIGSTDHVGVVTVYGLALHHGYDLVDDELYVVEGSHTPVAITFDVLNGKYSLKEYWRPGDGIYYAPDIREKFPDHIEDEVMDTQKYYVAQNQECYVQAMRNNGVEVSNPGWQPLSIEELSWFNETFYPLVYDKQGNPISVNSVSGFFSSYYDDVRNMDFEEFMRYFPEDGSFASDAEFEALKTVEAWPFDWVETRDDMPVPIHKYQARIVDMVLKENAGITTADLNTSDVAYLADYDAFYNYTSDFGPGMFTCTRGEVDGDIVRLYEEFETGTDMLTLRKVGNNYMIVAHQRIEGDNNAERVYGR